MTFTASHHEPADALVKPYEEIEHIVSETLKEGKIRPSIGEEERPYTEDEIRKEVKFLILAMQGGWTSQHSYRWKCVDSAYEEHAAGPVHIVAPKSERDPSIDDPHRNVVQSDDVPNWPNPTGYRASLNLAALQATQSFTASAEHPWMHQRLPFCQRHN